MGHEGVRLPARRFRLPRTELKLVRWLGGFLATKDTKVTETFGGLGRSPSFFVVFVIFVAKNPLAVKNMKIVQKTRSLHG